MASASSIRQTVLELLGLPSPRLACAAMSAVASRLKGRAVWWTASHATALTRACSRGGKPSLPSSPRGIVQAQRPLGPASSPIAHGVGMEVYLCGCLDIREEGIGLQEQHQCGTLSQLIRDRPLPPNTSGLLHEIIRKVRTIGWRGTWQNAHPFVFTRFVPMRSPRSLPEMRGQPYN